MAKRSTLIKGLVKGDLKFFRSTAPREELQKGYWISNTQKVLHNIKLKEDTDILNPHFIIKSDDTILSHPYNYCYFFDTKRFYYVDNVILLPQGQMEIVCSVDPLYSFVNEIFNMTAFEDRASNIGTGYIQDEEMVFNASPQAKVYEFGTFPNQKGFTGGESYVVTVANAMGYVSTDYDPDKNKGTIYPSTIIPMPVIYKSFINDIVDRIEVMRSFGWGYSQDLRTSNGYVDCSSLIVRAFNDGLNLDQTLENPFLGGNANPETAAGIAEWFVNHPDYYHCIFSVREDSEFNRSLALTAGDLVFFEVGSSDSRNTRFPYGNTQFLRSVFGQTKKSNNTPYYGVGHVAFCYKGFVGNNNPLINWKLHSLKGYDCDINNVVDAYDYDYIDPETKQRVGRYVKVYPYYSSGNTYYPSTGDVWLLEALPYKTNSWSTLDKNGNYKILSMAKKANSSNQSIQPYRGGIVWNNRGGEREKISSTYTTEDKILDYLASAGEWDERFEWSDNSFYFVIRPNYAKIIADFGIQQSNE